jgi:hypothetical protein
MIQNQANRTLFDSIPEYQQIIGDLSTGKLSGKFSLNDRKSKLSSSLEDILFGQNNDELSYFILFMETKNQSNYVKFLLDLNNFVSSFSVQRRNGDSFMPENQSKF